jgi:hypothetical protein
MSDTFERKVITPAEREARKAFKQADAAKAMTEHDRAQKAFHENRERLKALRLARDSGQTRAKWIWVEWSVMRTKLSGLIIRTEMDARQAEPGPSILLMLASSTALAVVVLSIVLVIILPTLTGLHNVMRKAMRRWSSRRLRFADTARTEKCDPVLS